MFEEKLFNTDRDIFEAILNETRRQSEGLELIASENFTSDAVLAALGSVLTNKYAEGYPGKRYYGGCEFVDVVERLAIERARELFGAEHANVQPHSGSQANMAVYFAVLKPGDTILSMDLSCGGHLSHGSRVSFSGKLYNVVYYGVDRETEYIDFDEVAKLTREYRPRLIITGYSAYPRRIDFAKFREIADSVGAYLMADIAHIAGLVVGKVHPDPVPYAHFVTTTTHKTLRGPRGGLILTSKEFAKAIDKAVFPGMQGGPLEHVIAAKAVAFKEAMRPEFVEYQKKIVENARALAETLLSNGLRLVSGGTDNHLMLVDTRSVKMTGKVAEALLAEVNITVNKNSIPYDPEKPTVTSGIRIGVPAITTRGMGKDEMRIIGKIIADVLKYPDDEEVKKKARSRVQELVRAFPLYRERIDVMEKIVELQG